MFILDKAQGVLYICIKHKTTDLRAEHPSLQTINNR